MESKYYTIETAQGKNRRKIKQYINRLRPTWILRVGDCPHDHWPSFVRSPSYSNYPRRDIVSSVYSLSSLLMHSFHSFLLLIQSLLPLILNRDRDPFLPQTPPLLPLLSLLSKSQSHHPRHHRTPLLGDIPSFHSRGVLKV